MAVTPLSNTCTVEKQPQHLINQHTCSWPQRIEISPTEMHYRELVRGPAGPAIPYILPTDYRVDVWSRSRLQTRRDCTWLTWWADGNISV